MKFIMRLVRLIKINYILARYNLDELILATRWFYPVRFLTYFNPFYWTVKKKYTRGERIRCALEDLGPIFVKAGQILSTRRDLLPDDIAEELEKLQDRVPPFPGKIAKKIIEKSLKEPLNHVFAAFDLTALASASVAQVHAATLHDGSSVVVKVLRPNIEKTIMGDLDILTTLAALADRYSTAARHFKPKEIVAEIAHTLIDELDLMREGANASQLRRNFSNSPMLYVPKIYWNYSRSNILVLERIHGIPVHNVVALLDAKINLKKLAERGIEVFFTQVFRDCFFHADMHPGNIFVNPQHPEDPKFIAVDFGIMGSLNEKDQRYLAENFLAFFKRDYRRVAELHVDSGWLPADTRIDQFEGSIRAVCEPIFERPLREISFGQLLLRLFQTARRFNINIQPQLILLQKTLLNIEGLGRQLYPNLDLWNTASPYLEMWLKKQVGLGALIKNIRNQFPYWTEKFPELPGIVYETLQDQKSYHRQMKLMHQELVTQQNKNKNKNKKYFFLGSGAALVLTSAFLVPLLPFYASWFAAAGIIALFVTMVV